LHHQEVLHASTSFAAFQQQQWTIDYRVPSKAINARKELRAMKQTKWTMWLTIAGVVLIVMFLAAFLDPPASLLPSPVGAIKRPVIPGAARSHRLPIQPVFFQDFNQFGTRDVVYAFYGESAYCKAEDGYRYWYWFISSVYGCKRPYMGTEAHDAFDAMMKGEGWTCGEFSDAGLTYGEPSDHYSERSAVKLRNDLIHYIQNAAGGNDGVVEYQYSCGASEGTYARTTIEPKNEGRRGPPRVSPRPKDVPRDSVPQPNSAPATGYSPAPPATGPGPSPGYSNPRSQPTTMQRELEGLWTQTGEGDKTFTDTHARYHMSFIESLQITADGRNLRGVWRGTKTINPADRTRRAWTETYEAAFQLQRAGNQITGYSETARWTTGSGWQDLNGAMLSGTVTGTGQISFKLVWKRDPSGNEISWSDGTLILQKQ
jgi:hypothetical protein